MADIDKQREAVARAICISCEDNPDHTGDARGNAYRWQDYLDCADAAIAALASQPQVPAAAVPDDVRLGDECPCCGRRDVSRDELKQALSTLAAYNPGPDEFADCLEVLSNAMAAAPAPEVSG